MKRIKYLLTGLCLIFLISNGIAQELLIPKNSFYLELLGNGGLYSINYERNITSNTCIRIGFATWKVTDIMSKTYMGRMTTVPVLASYYTGLKKSHFEIGGGFLFGKENMYNGTNPILNLTLFIGYRYQPQNRGIIFRAGFTPFLSLDKKADYPDPGLSLSGGISTGYHF
jgi:hypothetical protein